MEKLRHYKVSGAQHKKFSPNKPNDGSIIAVAGDDFAIIAADSRLGSGCTSHTRNQNELFELSPKTVLGSTGCRCDVLALIRSVRTHMAMHEESHLHPMPTNTVAQMLSVLMYDRPPFRYFASNVVAGLDTEGKGVVYSYDLACQCNSTTYCAIGTACALLQTALDLQIGNKNMMVEGGVPPKLPKESAVAIVTNIFISAAKNDICTGDSVMINIITKNGIERKAVQLPKDQEE